MKRLPSIADMTYGNQLGFCTSDIRLVAAAHRFSVVPGGEMSESGAMEGELQRTNLIATWLLLSRFVPSKITPNEPSPIFLPTL